MRGCGSAGEPILSWPLVFPLDIDVFAMVYNATAAEETAAAAAADSPCPCGFGQRACFAVALA